MGQDRTRVDGIEFLGGVGFPIGTTFRGTEFGGISGLTYDARTGLALRELRYDVEAIPQDSDPAGGFADNGLVELLAVDNTGTYLSLERSFAAGVGNTIQLFVARTQGGTDIGGFESLVDPESGEVLDTDAPVAKELLVDLAELGIDPRPRPTASPPGPTPQAARPMPS